MKECKKSGSGTSKSQKYIYNDQLQFLSKLTEGRQTEDSLTDNSETGKSDSLDSSEDFKVPNKETVSRKKRKCNDLELKMLKILESSTAPTRHLSFFNGIVPSLETFDDDDVIQFQIGILQLRENIKRKKKEGSFRNLSPVMCPGQAVLPHNMTQSSQQLTVQVGPSHTRTEASNAGLSANQYSPVSQFRTNYVQEQSTSSPSGYDNSDSVSPAFSTSSNNTDIIDFTSL
jgi:hypothetical protein